MIPVSIVRRIVESWIATFDFPENAYQHLAAATSLRANSWRKRLSENPTNGLWRFEKLDPLDVDELLVAMDATHLWHVPPLDRHTPPRRALRCHDCRKAIETPDDYRPLELFRIVPQVTARIWDSTKQKWLPYRRRRGRRGGRRFRHYDLCRRCAGEALRFRASKNPKLGHKGRHGILRTRDRVAPVRGGRPRLLNEQELRSAHIVYLQTGFSINELARRLYEQRGSGTQSGYAQSLLYGWRNLGLEIRPRGLQSAMSRHGTDGTKTKKHKVQCRARLQNGRRCTQFVRRIVTETGSHPAHDGLCWNHGVGSRLAREAVAA